jgi:hypothetical protein
MQRTHRPLSHCGAARTKAGKNKIKKEHWRRFSAEKNKNTGRKVLQNKGPNRAYSR